MNQGGWSLGGILGGLAATWLAASAGAAEFTGSGDPDIDRTRREISTTATDAGSFQERTLLLYLWIGSLQQQGADTRAYFETDQEYFRLERELARVAAGEQAALQKRQWALIDRGYSVVEQIQRRLQEEGPIARARAGDPATVPPGGDVSVDWPMFQGNAQHTGFSAAPGPRQGRTAWKFPVGLGWYSRPVIEGDRVYVASPGMRTMAYCLDLATGREIWKSTQTHPLVGIYKYPAIASTPVVGAQQVLLREVNSHGGNEGQARHVVHLDKSTGRMVARRYAGHIDYRTQYAPLAASERFMVYPFGVHDIYSSPAICQNFNRLICADAENTRKFWDLNIGDIDALAEPVISGDHVFCGTMEGYLYALRLGPPREGNAIRWAFKADGAINTAVAVAGGRVYFGCNAGSLYCLEAETGRVVWRRRVTPVERGARKHFTTPLIEGNTIYAGAANRRLYALAAADGTLRWELELSEWIRSRPVAIGGAIVVATVDGQLHAAGRDGKLRWTQRISTHPIYADLAASGDRLAACDSNLWCVSVNGSGQIMWKKSLLPAWENDRGERIFSDQLSGGTYYQSKPTAYRGKVYFGTPAGFLHAVDARSGQARWKFEMGGGISVGPACADGRVYAGQQGGERFFYCLDAESGALVWKQTLPGGWVWGSATVSEGRVYVPTVSGYAVCLDGATGHILWMYPTAKSIPAEPAVAGNLVYFGSWSRSLYAFDKRTGEVVWKYTGVALDSGTLVAYRDRVFVPHHANVFTSLDAQTGQLVSTGVTSSEAKGKFSDFNATPAFHNGRAFFSARGSMGLRGVPLFSTAYCVDPEKGTVLWTHPDGGGLSAPAVANGRVYIASGNSPFLYCLDEATGKPHWVYQMGHRVEEATLCLYQTYLYVLSADGYVHAIE